MRWRYAPGDRRLVAYYAGAEGPKRRSCMRMVQAAAGVHGTGSVRTAGGVAADPETQSVSAGAAESRSTRSTRTGTP